MDGPDAALGREHRVSRLIRVEYAADVLELEAPAERVRVVWNGPRGVLGTELAERVSAALASPVGYPRISEAVIPGDRVVLALDLELEGWPLLVTGILEELAGAGVGADSVRVLTHRPLNEEESRGRAVAEGMLWTVHDPSDRENLAYLATTKAGRRIYLNRHLVDADVVVAAGRIGFEPGGTTRVPSDVIDPGLSDDPARLLGEQAEDEREVDWLLGSRFHVGVIAGVGGAAEVLAGDAAAVGRIGRERLRALWHFEAEERAEVVVVGLGRPGQTVGWKDLGVALTRARGLIKRGGKIVVLSDLAESPGPLVALLSESNDPIEAYHAMPRGEPAEDALVASQLMKAVESGKVYLSSRLEEGIVEGLNMIALGSVNEAKRVVELSESCSFVSQVDWTDVALARHGSEPGSGAGPLHRPATGRRRRPRREETG
jgi:nickel-dependent lactate racemase